MDAVRKLIQDRIRDLGLSYKEVSIRIGRNHAYLQQFLKRSLPIELKERDRKRLADLLRVPEDELRGPSPPLPTREYHKVNGTLTDASRNITKSDDGHNFVDKLSHSGPQLFGDRDDLPVFGTAQGGSGGALIMTNEAVDWVIRPAPLLRVRDGYGMIVTGDSMSPKHENGSTALVNPHLPPRNGDTCVFRNHQDDGTVNVLIKELRRFTDDAWYVRQYNPRRDFSLKRSEWQVCHVTVGSYFGR